MLFRGLYSPSPESVRCSPGHDVIETEGGTERRTRLFLKEIYINVKRCL